VWQKQITHSELKAFRVVRGATQDEVEFKATLQLQLWDERWQRVKAAEAKRRENEQVASRRLQQKEWAVARTREAKAEFDALGTLLRDSLEADPTIDWESLKDRSPFPIEKPPKPEHLTAPPEPSVNDFSAPLSWLEILLPPLKKRKFERQRIQFEQTHAQWQQTRLNTDREKQRLSEKHEQDVQAWEHLKQEFVQEKKSQQSAIDDWRSRYFQREANALYDYWELVLSRSQYPDKFPKSFKFDYLPSSKTLIVEYCLPNADAMPRLKELKYVATKQEFQEVHLPATALNRTYDEVLYQIALRTLNELFQSDAVDALTSVVFNGWVNSVDRATGKEVNACVLSVQAPKSDILEINLAQVEPRACFKKLKGVSGAKLADLSPVRPVLQLNKQDERFVSSYEVADALDDSSNLAAMDWLDFENLIREVFEEEFSRDGGEVKITRASRDGGVDAVAFDPDPIRGGKIVIQAKRYTNTVGVSAVRDLYGTVVNEGATKGILVTTADYGPDAYEFAKDKPLTLLSGNELLYLLQKHGHRAKIDLAEAKRTLAEQEKAQRAAQS
jgi:restriction system protein